MKKGFTLIELLAVIVVLSVIAIIAVPSITGIVEESQKQALETSVKEVLSSANYFTISNDGVYEFLFDKTHKGTTKQGESLGYKGDLNAEGKLYIDKEGDISLCVYNDKYYAYKNYNGSSIIIGEKKDDTCDISYDYISNKYVAYLESEGTGSNVYSKDEVNELISSLTSEINSLKEEISTLKSNQDSYATKEELTSTSNNLTTTINTNKDSIETVKNSLNNYTLKSELNTTNSNLDSLTSIVKNNTNNITSISSTVSNLDSSVANLNSSVGNLNTSFTHLNNTKLDKNGSSQLNINFSTPISSQMYHLSGITVTGNYPAIGFHNPGHEGAAIYLQNNKLMFINNVGQSYSINMTYVDTVS